jgi:single-strand selective monofunctional uracil DNA glycosylase
VILPKITNDSCPNAISLQLQRELKHIAFPEVAYTYQPLDYAWEPHALYHQRYGTHQRRILLVGMNPGPFGMAQTGVPFGAVPWVRDWMNISGTVHAPKHTHPRRPVLGFHCPRVEVSGQRLWSWAAEHYTTPERFFQHFFVLNYCPLLFVHDSGKNITPEQLPVGATKALFAACDRALLAWYHYFQPEWLLGIGLFAAKRIQRLFAHETRVRCGVLPHPSPANPQSNQGWSQYAQKALQNYGLTGL